MKETKAYSHEMAVRRTTHLLQNQFKTRENVLVAELMINGGEYESAIMTLKEALAYEPDNLDALNNISVAYILKGSIPEASEAIQKVLKIKPDDEVANSNYEYINTRFQKQKVS
jgi:tetratricopeptide (TPR) repeat protein